MTFGELAQKVRDHIKQTHRYEHCVRVAEYAQHLAHIHGADSEKARTAGIVHDLARLYTPERLLRECERRAMPLGDYERAHPIVLHAPLSAQLAKEKFGIDDAQTLSAIAKHTLGSADMSPLDCVLYLADTLEPGRVFAQREELAAIAERDLAQGMRGALKESARYLQGKGLGIAPQTADAMRAFGVELTEVHPGGSS